MVAMLMLVLAAGPERTEGAEQPPVRRPLATPSTSTQSIDTPTESALVPKRKRLTPDELWQAAAKPPPTPPGVLSQHRIVRFVGALVGGAVGLGLPLLFLPAADAPCSAGAIAGVFCPTSDHFLIGAASLVGTIGGAAAGFAIAGGAPSGGALVAGTVAGLLLSLLLSGVVVGASAGPVLPTDVSVPLLLMGGALVVGGQATALLLRDDATEGRPELESGAGRIALTSLTFAGSSGVSTLLVALSVALTRTALLPIIAATISAALVTTATWAVHRALGGKGSFLAAVLGLLGVAAVGVVGGGLLAVVQSAPIFGSIEINRLRGGALTAALGGSLLVGALGVPLALEASHGAILAERYEGGLSLSVGGAPVPGGGIGVVTARF